MPSRAIFTSCNWAYLDRALVLLESIRLHEPEATAVLMLVEPREHSDDLEPVLKQFDQVIYAPDLPIRDFDQWIFGHDVVEACTAVKGTTLVQLLERFREVVYLDPDTRLYGPLDACWSLLSRHSAVLTPHLLAPERTRLGIVDNELSALKHGTFNLGFIGVAASAEGRELAHWWAARTREFCTDDIAQGIFTDQRWMDLVPSYFPGAAVLRDPGYNVASWNLGTRDVAMGRDGQLLVNGSPLTFWHFTKALGVGPAATARSGNVNAVVGALWSEYLRSLTAVTASLPPLPDWGYGTYSSGQPIHPDVRRAYRSDRSLRVAFPRPFASARFLSPAEQSDGGRQ